MAIRLVNQPVGIGGLAAYAAGRGSLEERQRKYATDFIQTRRDRSDRFNLLNQQQQFALGLDLRRERLGAETDRRRSELRIGELKYADMLRGDREERELKREGIAEARRRAEADVAGLTIPSWVPPADRAALEKKKSTSRAFTGFDKDFADEAVRKGFSDSLADFTNYLGGLKPPSAAEEFKRNVVYMDQAGGIYDEPGTERVPFNKQTGRPLEYPEQPDPMKAFNDAVMKRYEKNLTETDEYDQPLYSEESALQDAVDRQKAIERGRQKLEGIVPAESGTGAPGTTPAGGWDARRAYQQAIGQQQAADPAGGSQQQEKARTTDLYTVSESAPEPWAKELAKGAWNGRAYPRAFVNGEWQPMPTSQEEYDALTKGTRYVKSDGKLYVKGG